MASILVVDDEAEVGEAVRWALVQAGFDVSVAHNATAAMKSMRQSVPDIVITDVIMPKLNGLELIKFVREHYPRVQVIAISGGGSLGPLGLKPDAISTHAFVAAATEAGAIEMLAKPFDLEVLLAAVRRHLPN